MIEKANEIPPPTIPSTPSSVPPPHPFDSKWHIYIEPETYGPYTGHELAEFAKEGRINAGTQVLAVGGEEWARAGNDSRLASIFKPMPLASNVAPPPANISAAPGSTVVHVHNQINQTPIIVPGLDGAEPKSPGVALLLSFLICGAGQLYCGKIGKGILMFIACIVLWLVLLGWIISIWSMVDAYQTAKKMNLKFLASLQNRTP